MILVAARIQGKAREKERERERERDVTVAAEVANNIRISIYAFPTFNLCSISSENSFQVTLPNFEAKNIFRMLAF